MNVLLLSTALFDWLSNCLLNDNAHSEFLIRHPPTGLVFLFGYWFTKFSHTLTIPIHAHERPPTGK